MKKRLNAESVTNELRGVSAFFPNYEKTTPLPENWKTRKPAINKARKPENNIYENQKTEKQEMHQEQLGTLPLLDVNEEPTRKDTYWITDGEFEILEDVKRELRCKFGLKVTKGELVRCSLHLLNTLYQKDGEASTMYKALKVKRCDKTQEARKLVDFIFLMCFDSSM